MARLLLLLSILLLTTGCAATGPHVEIAGKKVTVEVVRTVQEQARGLMFREQMDEDHGMLFVYTTETMLSFWMKNTRIPLDILYFDRSRKLVTIAANAQPCRRDPCATYPSNQPVQYVLEINGGLAEEWGIELGDELTLHLE